MLLDGIAKILARHPDLRVQLRIANAPTDPIAANVDVALHVGPIRDSSAIVRQLATLSWVLVASPGYVTRHGLPRKPADLARHQCLRLLGDRPQRAWQLLDSKRRRVTAAVGGAFECDDSRILGDAIHAGLGIGVGCGSFTATLDGSNLDHLTSLSFGREDGTGFGTAPSA